MAAKTKKTKRSKNTSKWKLSHIITAYELARQGLTEASIAKCLGISKPTFIKWEQTKPEFREAVQRGRAYLKRGANSYTEMLDYYYRLLPNDLKELWAKIHQFNLADVGVEKVKALFAGRGRLIRQKIFIAALIKCNFTISRACRMIGLPRITVDKWREDEQFQRLIKQVEEMQKDWGEDCLRHLVAQGDFNANKLLLDTIGKDRGYGKNQLNVNVQGQIEHKHQLVLMEDLDLPLNMQKMILRKVREQRKLVESNVVEAA